MHGPKQKAAATKKQLISCWRSHTTECIVHYERNEYAVSEIGVVISITLKVQNQKCAHHYTLILVLVSELLM